jgi:hypothetical protein
MTELSTCVPVDFIDFGSSVFFGLVLGLSGAGIWATIVH